MSNSKLEGVPAINGPVDVNALHIFPEILQPFRGMILAYTSSVVSTFVGYPLDTVKTRMQTHAHFTSYFHCVRTTYASEGVRGFFRGVWAPLFSNALSKSLNVSLYTYVKPKVCSSLYGADSANTLIRNIPVNFVSGAIAGTGISVFASPFEFTKVYAQLETLLRRNNNMEVELSTSTRKMVSQIIKYEGVSGLYSGYRFHLLRDSLYSGLFYSFYETIKITSNSISGNSPLSVFLAGGFSGVFSWALMFQIDTMKSIVQKDKVKAILFKKYNLSPDPPVKSQLERSMYRGLLMQMTRSFVVSMVFFSLYESAMYRVV